MNYHGNVSLWLNKTIASTKKLISYRDTTIGWTLKISGCNIFYKPECLKLPSMFIGFLR